MSIRIRQVTAEDAPELAELLREIGWFGSFKNEPFEAVSQQVRLHIEQCLADNSHSIFVAEPRDGKIVGYGSCTGCLIFS
jgi:hypothetical protein